MRIRILKTAIICVVVSGCASELRPLVDLSFTTGIDACAKSPGLELTVCQAHRKSAQLMDAHFEFWNSPELYDVPLLALASAAAGLLLFDGSTDALKGVGLAAAAIVSGRAYASPAEIREALRNGADGYACLADAGEVVKNDAAGVSEFEISPGNVVILRQTRMNLARNRSALLRMLNDSSNFSGGDVSRAQDAAAKAANAIKLYDKQVSSLRFANTTLRNKARALSMGLLKRIERKPIDFSSLYQQIARNALQTSQFQLAKSQAQPSTPAGLAAAVVGAPPGDQVVLDVENDTGILVNVPDIETAVAKFDGCLANSLSGSVSNI